MTTSSIVTIHDTGIATEPEEGLPARARMYGREIRADLTRVWRTPAALIPMLILPWSFYAFFSMVMAPTGSPRAVYELATYGVFSAMAPCLFGFGAGIANDRESGILKLKQVSPLPIGAFLLARLATAVTFTLVVLVGLYGLAIFGAGVRLSAGAWITLLAVHLAGAAPLCLLGLSVGLRARSSAAVAITNLLFYGLAVLSGLWIPLFEFPHVLQELAWALPTTHLAALALGAAGQPVPGTAAAHAACITAFTVGLGALAWRGWARGLG
jgi:ABC-2 type transport system permease protein